MGMFRGKNPPSAPSLPAQQAAPDLMDIIDEISGLQTITVTGPDGKKRRVTQRIPLTPEEQKTKEQAENLISQAVKNIEALYKHDPATVANYQPFIQAFSDINDERMRDLSQIGDFKNIAEQVAQFRDISKELTMREFDNGQRMAEENLARRGLQRSSEASDYRAAMLKERALLAQQSEVNAQNYGQDLKNRQLETESNIYGLREEGRRGRLEQAEAGYNLERQKSEDVENTRQNAINENVNAINIAQGLGRPDTERSNLGLASNNSATNMFSAQAKNQNQRYANDIQRMQGQYGMDMNRFRSTPAKFGQRLGDLAFAKAGESLGSGMSGGSNLSGASKNRAPVERK